MNDCCKTNTPSKAELPPVDASSQPGHLVIIGGGSAAFAATTRAAERGWRVTIINDGLPIGGTCVNVGCVPSKALIRAAEAHHRAAHHPFAGIESQSRVSDFGSLTRQTHELVETLRQEKYLDVVKDLPGVEIITGAPVSSPPRKSRSPIEHSAPTAFSSPPVPAPMFRKFPALPKPTTSSQTPPSNLPQRRNLYSCSAAATSH